MILQWFLHIQRIFCIISNLVWVGKVEMDKRVASKVNKYRSIIHFVIFTNYMFQWKPGSLMKEYSITPSEKVTFASPFETTLVHTKEDAKFIYYSTPWILQRIHREGI